MVKGTSAGARLVATLAMVAGLTAVAVGEVAAEDPPEDLSPADSIRQMVQDQRDQVLAEVAAALSGEDAEDEEAGREIEEPEAEDGEPEDGEPEDGEPEDGEPEDGEPEDGEGDVGGEGECEPAGAEAAGAGEDAEAAGGEEYAEAEIAEPEAAGESTVCELPETGVGLAGGGLHTLPGLLAAAGVLVAGLSVRRRFDGLGRADRE